jgi:hypothetical protein
MDNTAVAYASVSILGLFIAVVELGLRYRDDPVRSVRTPAGALYVLTNALAAALTLYVVRAFGWTYATGSPVAEALSQVLVAAFGSLAILRTKFASVGNPTSSGGSFVTSPARLLEGILTILDRSVDREQGKRRAVMVGTVMPGINFEEAQVALPTMALALMDNVADADAVALVNDLKALKDIEDIDDDAKAVILGSKLVRITGPDLLDQAVTLYKSTSS